MIIVTILTCVISFYNEKKSSKDIEEFNLIVGICSGTLTSTPAFSASKRKSRYKI